jgi:hypothetical protein
MLYSLVIFICLADKCTLENNGGVIFIGKQTNHFECNGSAMDKMKSFANTIGYQYSGRCVSSRIINELNLKEL